MLEPIPALQATSQRRAEASSDLYAEEIPPRAEGELADPTYPPEALKARAGEVVVYVTVTIDTTGAVTDVIPSWGRINIPSRFSEEFIAAVRSCVQKWKFEPARVVYWAKDGDQERRYLYTETIAAKTDVKFTFSAAKGSR